MPIKDINELLNMTIAREKNKSLRKERFSERIKPKVNPKYTSMSDVVPSLGRGDFLNCWKEDRRELEKIRTEKEKIFQENKKLRAVMNTTWSKDWPNEVSKIFKESKDDKTKT
jgi:hypothetical protein